MAADSSSSSSSEGAKLIEAILRDATSDAKIQPFQRLMQLCVSNEQFVTSFSEEKSAPQALILGLMTKPCRSLAADICRILAAKQPSLTLAMVQNGLTPSGSQAFANVLQSGEEGSKANVCSTIAHIVWKGGVAPAQTLAACPEIVSGLAGIVCDPYVQEGGRIQALDAIQQLASHVDNFAQSLLDSNPEIVQALALALTETGCRNVAAVACKQLSKTPAFALAIATSTENPSVGEALAGMIALGNDAAKTSAASAVAHIVWKGGEPAANALLKATSPSLINGLGTLLRDGEDGAKVHAQDAIQQLARNISSIAAVGGVAGKRRIETVQVTYGF